MAYTIFLSHHESETDLAQRIRSFLKKISQCIEVNTFVQKANRDADYRKWINESIAISDMFMFLYTDDTRELSWAAHELGLYLGMRNDSDAHVVCLKSRDIVKMPAVMSHIEPINALAINIQTFLEDLLVKGAYSEQRRLANDNLSLEELGEKIKFEAKFLAGLFRSKIHTQYFADRLIIRNIECNKHEEFASEVSSDRHVVRSIMDPELHQEVKYVLDFSNTQIETNDHVKRILHLPDDCTWYDLVMLSDRDNPSDRFFLAAEVLRHASSEQFHDASAMMLADIEVDGNILIPIISRVEKRDRLPITYYLLLIPDPSSRHEEIGKHNDLAQEFARDTKLVLLLYLARRFRWNIVEPYIWKIRKVIGIPGDLKKELGNLVKELDALEDEASQYNLDDGHLAALCFPEEHREPLKKQWILYGSIRRELADHVDKCDATAVLEILVKFQLMNRSFMETGLDVYKATMRKLPTLDESNRDWRNEFFS